MVTDRVAGNRTERIHHFVGHLKHPGETSVTSTRNIIVLLLLCGLLSCASSSQPSTEDSAEDQTLIAAVSIRELTAYKKAGRPWRSFVIPSGLDREHLVELARELHRRDPVASFRFFDDASQFDQYREWDQHYPNASHPYPEQWVSQHYIAMLNEMLVRGGSRWQLEAAEGGLHLLSTDAKSMTIAVIE